MTTSIENAKGNVEIRFDNEREFRLLIPDKDGWAQCGITLNKVELDELIDLLKDASKI